MGGESTHVSFTLVCRFVRGSHHANGHLVRLRATAACGDQSRRRPADQRLVVEVLSPCERRHIAIFLHRLVIDEAKALPKRGVGVQVGAVIEQHARELVTLTQADRLRDDAREERGVTANPAASSGPAAGAAVRSLPPSARRRLYMKCP